MNVKEAKEIIEKGTSFRLEKDQAYSLAGILDKALELAERAGKAKGVLEYHEKIQPLVDAVNKYMTEKENIVADQTLIRHTFKRLVEALADYKREVLGE